MWYSTSTLQVVEEGRATAEESATPSRRGEGAPANAPLVRAGCTWLLTVSRAQQETVGTVVLSA